MNARTVTLVSFLVCWVAFGGTVPTPQNDAQSTGVTSSSSTTSSSSQHHVVSGSEVVSAANGWLVKSSESQVNNQCISRLSIRGNGVDKTVEYACGKVPVNIINQNNTLVVGDEWYSDQPKTLVHLSGNQCQKEVFSEEGGKTSSTSETLSEQECEKIHTRISELKKQQQKWSEWVAQQQLAAEQQFQQLQQNLFWLQSHLFGGMFGGN